MVKRAPDRETLMVQLGLIPTRAAILVVLVGLLHGALFHFAATGESWLFITMAAVNLVALVAYAVFGPDVW